jgi:tetratricopeptide (TPR) repeat protein
VVRKPIREIIRRASWSCALLVALAAPARAQDDATRAAARALAYEGNAAYERGDYAVAEQKLDKAFSLVTVPILGLASARARQRLGKLVEAAERYRQVIRLDEVAMRSAGAALNLALQQRAQQEAAAELEALLPKIPRLVIDIIGVPAREVNVRLDGTSLPNALVGESYPINPGVHQLEAWHGTQHRVRELSLEQGERQILSLQFALAASPTISTAARIAADPKRPPATDLQRVLGGSLLSLGAAVVTVGVAIHLYSEELNDEIEARSIGGALSCLPGDRARCDRYNKWRQVPPIAYAGGALLAASGGFLLVWPWAKPGLELSVVIAPETDGASPSVFANLKGPTDLSF